MLYDLLWEIIRKRLSTAEKMNSKEIFQLAFQLSEPLYVKEIDFKETPFGNKIF